MHLESFREYCLSKRGVTESCPFGENTLVFKVLHKMFALTNLDGNQFKVNLKCDPEKAIALREEYYAIKPGYHMNKKHWNTIEIALIEDDRFILQLIDHSYDLVLKGFTKKEKETLSSIS